MGWRHRCSAVACVAAGRSPSSPRRCRWSALAAALLVGLNRRFYALLARRLGVVRGRLGVGLHWLHHLVAVAAVPAGLLRRCGART